MVKEMLVEVVSGEDKSIVLKIREEVAKKLEEHLPFTSTARIWKEEIYFETPIDLPVDELKLEKHTQIELGKLYYWKPGKAFCIFYGLSEPYTPVYLIGDIIGPLRILQTVNKFEDGEKIKVDKHEVMEIPKEILRILKDEGYEVATPLILGSREIVASKNVNGRRIAFILYVEDYGIHIEGEGIYRPSKDIISLRETLMLKNKVKSRFRNVRLDLSEDEWICLTGVAESIDDLKNLLREYEAAYLYVLGELQI